jgi:hypothetical protein
MEVTRVNAATPPPPAEYMPADDPLRFPDDPDLAWGNVVILSTALARHAAHAASRGAIRPDVRLILERDTRAVLAVSG